MSYYFSKMILRLFGWKVTGHYPYDCPKKIIVAAPHTSWIDFPIGLLVRSYLRDDIRFLGKESLFRPPFGFLFRALGGYPVDRSGAHQMVDQIIDIFNQHERFAIVLAPEGTRKKVDKLKTGFYYIAQGAGIPIVLSKFDFERREVRFEKPFYPSGNIDEDMNHILSEFRGVKGRHPHLSL